MGRVKMSVGAGEFREFVLNGEHTGRVRLCVEFTVKPEKLDAFKTEFQKCIDISVKEKGCDQYETMTDFKSPNTVWLLEDWKTREDLKTHMLAQQASGCPNLDGILDGIKFNVM